MAAETAVEVGTAAAVAAVEDLDGSFVVDTGSR